LEKILLNLLFNSVKFTPAGGRVELWAGREGGDLVLKVSDTGMGISEEDLSRVFDRFFQVDSSAQRKYQGTGIGLALVKELAEAQGGTVRAESRLGQGTLMTVRIPAPEAPTGAVTEPSPAPEASASQGEVEWLQKLYRRAEMFPAMTSVAETLRPYGEVPGKGPKVLVADDEPDMLRFLKSQLEGAFEVLEAVDGDQAVEKAKQFLPEIILLDMMMPGKDGITACREIKAHLPTRSIPVVLLTARADDATKMGALEAGASDFLTKPFSVTELRARVQNLVVSHRSQRELTRQKAFLEATLEKLKDTETQLVQTEKMASLGRLSAGIIHEINNPLNYAMAALHLLRAKGELLPSSERTKYGEVLGDVEEGVGRVARIVSDLRSFTRTRSGAPDSIDLKEVVDTSLRFLGPEWKERVDLRVEGLEGLRVWADRNDLIHVFVNLIQNSLDALKEKEFREGGPRLTLRADRDGSRVRVSVRDNGPGIAPEHLDKIFDPFFTTKEVGQGMGLGLSICYKLMERQGGSITAKSGKGEFAEFILEVPAEKPADPTV
jgi:signal transduction histidine kinase